MRRSPDGALSATRQRYLKRPISPSLQRPHQRSPASSVRLARAERAPQSCSLQAWPQRSTARTDPHAGDARGGASASAAHPGSELRRAACSGLGINASFAHTSASAGNSPLSHSRAGSPLRCSTGRARAALGFHTSFRSAMPPMSISVTCSITSPATRHPRHPALHRIDPRSAQVHVRCAERPRATSRCSSSRPAAWPEGARAAASHTGALAGSDEVYDAAISRAGMLRVDTALELFDAVETLGARAIGCAATGWPSSPTAAARGSWRPTRSCSAEENSPRCRQIRRSGSTSCSLPHGRTATRLTSSAMRQHSATWPRLTYCSTSRERTSSCSCTFPRRSCLPRDRTCVRIRLRSNIDGRARARMLAGRRRTR